MVTATTVIGIYDDDVVYIRAVERMLRLGGFASFPVTTLDVGDAARVFSEAQCRVVLVDVMLYDEPRGFTFIERLRSVDRASPMPIIVTSGAHTLIKRMEPFLTANGCALLEKPFDAEELVSKVRSVLTLGSLGDESPGATLPRPVSSGALVSQPAWTGQ